MYNTYIIVDGTIGIIVLYNSFFAQNRPGNLRGGRML